jgi:hypothetical protein
VTDDGEEGGRLRFVFCAIHEPYWNIDLGL